MAIVTCANSRCQNGDLTPLLMELKTVHCRLVIWGREVVVVCARYKRFLSSPIFARQLQGVISRGCTSSLTTVFETAVWKRSENLYKPFKTNFFIAQEAA